MCFLHGFVRGKIPNSISSAFFAKLGPDNPCQAHAWLNQGAHQLRGWRLQRAQQLGPHPVQRRQIGQHLDLVGVKAVVVKKTKMPLGLVKFSGEILQGFRGAGDLSLTGDGCQLARQLLAKVFDPGFVGRCLEDGVLENKIGRASCRERV